MKLLTLEVVSRGLFFSVIKIYCLDNMMAACEQGLHLWGWWERNHARACCLLPCFLVAHFVHHNWRACSQANTIKLHIMNVGTQGI